MDFLVLIANDSSHRTMTPLLFPPHVIAVASIYLAAKLDTVDNPSGTPSSDAQRTSAEVAEILGNHGAWEQRYKAEVQDLEGQLAEKLYIDASKPTPRLFLFSVSKIYATLSSTCYYMLPQPQHRAQPLNLPLRIRPKLRLLLPRTPPRIQPHRPPLPLALPKSRFSQWIP